MDRRDFLLATGGAAIGAATPIDARAAVSPITHLDRVTARGQLSFDTGACAAASWSGDQAVRFASYVAALAGSDLALIAHDTDADSNCTARFHADVTWCAQDDVLALHPAFAFVTGLPGHFALDAHDAWAWQQVGGGQDLADALAAPFGLKILLAGHRGASPKLWTNEPIESLAQLSEVKIHAGGLSARVYAGLGAVPARVPECDLAAALAARVIAGAELGGPLDGASAAVASVAKFVAPGLAEPQGTALLLAIKLSVWEALSARGRAAIAAAAARQYQVTLAEERAYGPLMASALAARHGTQTVVIPREVTTACEAVSRAVVAEVAALDEAAHRLNASYMAFCSAIAHPNAPLVG